MKATLIDHMGDDLSVVNAARVSFAKESEWKIGTEEDHHVEEWCTGGRHDGEIFYWKLSERDAKLINYLARHKHWTPFAHTAITVHVKAPLFVARQLGKHQVGMVWNEVSRRYVKDEPEFYEPKVWRKAADNVKQGSSDEPAPFHSEWVRQNQEVCEKALIVYQEMVDEGVCPELARMVLPQSMYTEWYWTGNLVSFANMWKLRTDSHTQRETQQIAHEIGTLIAPLFPVAWKALTDDTR